MITVKIKFKVFRRGGGKEGRICYQISDGQKIRYVYTEYRLYSNEWNRRKACPVLTSADEERKGYLFSIHERIRKDIRELEETILFLRRRNAFSTIDDVIEKYLDAKKEEFFFVFMRRIIRQLRDMGKHRTSETYAATLNSFMGFRDGKDLLIEEVTAELVCSYEAWLKSRGISMNTVSFYMRILRAVNNRAVEEGIVE